MMPPENHFLLFISLVLFSSLSQALNPQYSDCEPLLYTCGENTFNISYPFKVDGRPEYCSSPGYYLTCAGDNSTLTLTISNKLYAIKSIDYANYLLNIIDMDFINRTCPHPYSNMAIDASLYRYSDHNHNLTLYINCSSSLIPSSNEIRCLVSPRGQHTYFMLNRREMNDSTMECTSIVEVPLRAETANEFVAGKSTFTQALQQGFFVRWTAGADWCEDCVDSGGFCGYNMSPVEDHTCFCSKETLVGSCSAQGKDDTGVKELFQRILVGLIVFPLGSILIGSFVLILWGHCQKYNFAIIFQKKGMHAKTVEAFLDKLNSLVTKRYTYEDVRKMTKLFSEKLGQGGYGTVYKGNLFDGHPVAVKVLSETEDDGEDFINEVAAIGNTSHVNVVSLRGYCAEGSKRALIYDFMPMGSLDKYICSRNNHIRETSLGWAKLYDIAIGIARGLEYLHRGCNTRIVHFDIKPHNILLDQDFCPKISDFGMAKLCCPKQSFISMRGFRGTIGYISPEVFSRTFGVVSSKSDVYSYGMMMLEMFGGKRSINAVLRSASEAYFPQSIYQHLDNMDYLMEYGVTGETEELARKMMIVGFWCIQTMPENRPSMTRVLDMLEGSINDLPIPPKPILSCPADFMLASYTESFEI